MFQRETRFPHRSIISAHFDLANDVSILASAVFISPVWFEAILLLYIYTYIVRHYQLRDVFLTEF